MSRLSLALCLVMTAGCATAHKQINEKTAVLGPPQLECTSLNNSCEWVRPWEVPGRKPGTTAQLTWAGCALHTLATGGHIAWECRNPNAKSGYWLWRPHGR